MNNFLTISIIGSIILTLLLNLLPVLFPKIAEKTERKIIEKIQEQHKNRIDPNTPKVHVFFSWKAMIAASIMLTILMNIIGFFAQKPPL